jgi:hypothetical protein
MDASTTAIIIQVTDTITSELKNITSAVDDPWLKWASVVTAMIAVASFVWNFFQLRTQRKVGLSLQIDGADGTGVIRNDSQAEFVVELNRYVVEVANLEPGVNQVADTTMRIFQLMEGDSQVLIRDLKKRMRDVEKQNLVIRQSLAPNESVTIHIHDLDIEGSIVAFVLLEFTHDRTRTYQLYRYASRSNIGMVPARYHKYVHPTNRWVRVLGFK